MAIRRDEFQRKHCWLNGTAVLLHRYSSFLEERLKNEFEEGVVATGVATAGGTTWLRGISIDRGDAQYLLRDFSGFVKLSREQTLIGAFRALIDYMLDLLAAIATQSPTALSHVVIDKAKKRRIIASKLPTTLRNVRLSLSSEDHDRFEVLREIRNLLEHNDGAISTDYIRLAGEGVFGQKLEVDGERVRLALGFVKKVAFELEQRAKALRLVND